MALDCATLGSEFKCILEPGESAYTFDASSEIYRIDGETMTKKSSYVAAPGLTGNQQIFGADRQDGPSFVHGNIILRCRPNELSTLLVHIMGTQSPSGTFKTEAGDPPYFGLMIEKGASVFQYNDLRANQVIVRGSTTASQGNQPQPIELIVNCIGKSSNDNATWPGSPPTLLSGETNKPYLLEEGTLTINSVAYTKEEFVLVINNYLAPEWYDNALTPSDICPQRSRTVQLRTRHPYRTTEDALIGISTAGVDGNFKLLYSTPVGGGNVSTDFQFGTMQPLPHDPNARGQGKVPLYMDWLIGASGSDDDLTIVNDANPA